MHRSSQRRSRVSCPGEIVGPRWLVQGVLCTLLLLAPSHSEAGAKRAFWYSLLIPGWGQRHLQLDSSARRFMTAEAGLWAASLGMRGVESIRRDTYRTYAATHASAVPSGGKERQYFDDLGFYDSRSAHNQLALIEDGPDAELYPEAAEFFWEWDATSSRERFRELRNSAQTADRQALFVTGIILANHLVSAIHAGRAGSRVDGDGIDMAAGRPSSDRPSSVDWHVGFGPISTGAGISLQTRW